ncbi:alginate export family protein [Solimonas sp. C16B3]|uniref:Alginate export family protein n=1 Tax=Solimonas marina TaxID=2714601 RepID=A0A970B6N9_9GAMM|nr:alginate export family protein [Solimonas marina]
MADAAARPARDVDRWQEDWSALLDPARRTQPLDTLKALSITDAMWLSTGLSVRERYESNAAAHLGAGGRHADGDLLQRVQAHAELHVDDWRAFVQLEDARAYGKRQPGPADANRLDLRNAFVEYKGRAGDAVLKLRAGRQDFAFDLQRFVSLREGPNVRQSFDAAWFDFEWTRWRVLGFISQPVQYRDGADFDDRSNGRLRFHTLRVERRVFGDGELSAYYARYEAADAHYTTVDGDEWRNIVDLRFAAAVGGFDWDLEAMGQQGRVGGLDVRAWALGARSGYRMATMWSQPRLGVQLDLASGDRDPTDRRLEALNPLFPNGSYFTRGGYTGDVNLVHIKPSLTLTPATGLSVMLSGALQWRQTVHDAVYVQPDLPIAGTAGNGGRWTGAYGQLRVSWQATAGLNAAFEAVHFDAGRTVERAGGRDSDYLGIELQWLW